ncbi:alkaline phosphatase family protein [Methylosinus sporium]|uniref:alkaline phosphatase family protein n=1 Tax=Methylosinus sporium TaxID=428 RepID=UPI003839E5B4
MNIRLLLKSACLATTALTATSIVIAAKAESTRTPIKHVIIVVGENRTFDNLFGGYRPAAGQSVDNLLSKGIIKADGTPGPNFSKAAQNIGSDLYHYEVVTPSTGAYATLPQPYTTYAAGVPQGVPDARFPADLPNGPYQISKYVSYASYTGDPVHRFFQMWQEWDGGKLDKFVWVEKTIGTGSNGNSPAGFDPKEGAISMGFFNMNAYTDANGAAQTGDAPYFKSLADSYAISDNYHQAVMGGTGANFQAIVTGHAAFYTDPARLDGSPATPPVNQIENPDPVSGTNNYYTQDGYSGGSYVNCHDLSQPGVAAVDQQLRSHGTYERKCAPGHYYLVNNYNMYWNQTPSATRTLGATKFTLPPQKASTIVDVLNAHNVSWKYYSADRGDDATVFANSVDGVNFPVTGGAPFHSYCGICDPLTGYLQVMTTSEYAKLQNYGAFLKDLTDSTLPAVSFVRPFEAFAAHPADSTSNLYEQFLKTLIARVQNSSAWDSTAIFITTDEGGGYYDSGYIQPVDFFGDGTRIPLIVVSPYAKKGYVDHTYYDHVSLLKFIERNWKLPTVSHLSRDNLPNPIPSRENPYIPANRPAIGDLVDLFVFADRDHDDDHDHDHDHGHHGRDR